MAGIDTSIYAPLLQPKSVEDYQNERDQRQQNALALMLKQMQVQQGQQAMQDDTDLRNALRQMSPTATTQDRITGLRATGLPGAYKQADAMEKSAADIAESQAKTRDFNAKSASSEYELARKRIEHTMAALAASPDAATARQHLIAGVQSGMWTMQDAQRELASLPQDPQSYQQWRLNHLNSVLGAKDQLEMALKNKEFGLKANNELISPDGSVNQPLLNAKSQVAKAGASNVNVNTEKSLLGTMADKVGGDIVSTSEAARDAQGTLTAVARIRSALNSGKAITGVGANQRVLLGQIGETMGLGSADSAETLAKTREAIQGLADLSLKGAGQMRGQGQITEGERALLGRATSGDITMTAPELNTLMNVFERNAKFQIGRNAKNVDILKRNPNAAILTPFLDANGQDNNSFNITPDAIAAEAARRAKARGAQ